MGKSPDDDGVFVSYEIVKRHENDIEVEITTRASITPSDFKRLARKGWVRRSPNVAAYLKPTYNNKEEEDVDEPLDETNEALRFFKEKKEKGGRKT